MKLAKSWTFLKYLFWLGPALVIAGLTAGAVAGVWAAIPLGMITIGVLIMLGWLVVSGRSVRGFWGRRSTQAGTNAIVATVAVLVILGLLNFLAVRYSNRLDLTENRIYTLAAQSQEIARDLQQPVKLWIFTPSPSPQDRQLLDNYRRETSQFTYDFVDPQVQPGIARRFGVQTVGEAYLEQGDRRQFLQLISAEERLSERRLTNGLAQLASDSLPIAYVLQGHGERPLQAGQGGLSQASNELRQERFDVQPLNLAESPQVPEDASVVVIAGPQRPLIPSELTALRNFLQRQGGLMVLVDPQTDPGLDELLNEWGIAFSDRLIVDPAGEAAGLGAGVTLITQYGDHPITQDFGNGISFYPLARPLELTQVEGVTAAPLLLTSEETQAHRFDENGQLQFDPAIDFTGSMTLGATFSRPARATVPSASPSPETSPETSPEASPSPEVTPSPSPEASSDAPAAGETRIVAIGNSSFISDGLLSQQLNQDVFLNAITWLSQEDGQVLSIRPREVTNRRLLLPGQQQVIVILLSLVFLPLFAFGMATGIWWKRR